jgi:hypothetical protein
MISQATGMTCSQDNFVRATHGLPPPVMLAIRVLAPDH